MNAFQGTLNGTTRSSFYLLSFAKVLYKYQLMDIDYGADDDDPDKDNGASVKKSEGEADRVTQVEAACGDSVPLSR
ncbi:hypothetical_protein (plasmid) [Leishmania braziliensis MHOM/BR/75/M2904]|uniref:Hypothetical_protein n=1 Tax=Leishmania braziliensis MHOM/BR/75/M2904 TaxID=420245 RepID=A0A3P3YYZ2_LEIBR|nr:unnamed protein product [Leishmania braziliensis]CAJ2467848.1 unnamed protein product [Leishmania braziliensis]SYZ63205.1 hypothetical_protein [Leishmania braziliensis MHOM/BR/75/M2904]